MMKDTSGPMYEMPLAQYDPDSQCWKTSEVTSLWALEMSSLTLPTWGGMRNGELFEQQRPERPTTEPDYSSLPTPTARDYKDLTMPPRLRDGRGHGSLPEKLAMLPTPVAGDGTKASANPETSARRIRKGNQPFLTDIVQTKLLPTPTTQDKQPGHHSQLRRNQVPLNTVVTHLLPSPLARDHKDILMPPSKDGKKRAQSELPTILGQIHRGVNMRQLYTDGNPFLEDQHQDLLIDSEDETP
jgi:hypothetical protein